MSWLKLDAKSATKSHRVAEALQEKKKEKRKEEKLQSSRIKDRWPMTLAEQIFINKVY